jgi:hypothetical protein
MHDASVIRMSDMEALIPDGYYILFDAAAPLTPRILTPYRSTRYHLAEFSNSSQFRAPETQQETFNLRHARKRCRIEIAFAFLKLRFRITAVGLQGTMTSMIQKLDSCVLLHNFIQSRFGRFDTVTALALRNAIQIHDLAMVEDDRTSSGSSILGYRDSIAQECFAQSGTAPSLNEVLEARGARAVMSSIN